MRSPRNSATKPLFHARQFWWLAHNVPPACFRAGLTMEQTRRVMDYLTERLITTNDLFDERKFKREVDVAIREVKNYEQT